MFPIFVFVRKGALSRCRREMIYHIAFSCGDPAHHDIRITVRKTSRVSNHSELNGSLAYNAQYYIIRRSGNEYILFLSDWLGGKLQRTTK